MFFDSFTERAKRVLDISAEEARALGHELVGTEHILLGLVREGTGVAAKVLSALNVQADRIREEVVRLVGRGQPLNVTRIGLTPRESVCSIWRSRSRESGVTDISARSISSLA